ncbi:2-hydroxyacyl-CoA dehydratase subunit D [Escherichia albertii]|uniref:2-hydroxyacyl-CoA dehydratase subunit D n=1 Tax=Escherichia albertii TaxID=208962 RepID=UPI0017B83013|nr:2-hydroxyacyl-CoA dehydratase family protein [Escherichia albertii]EEW0763059.1 2-hydroxyacyl-CoA dehydratase [Escherichia albertii]EFF0800548.1 2-hydroxyacyl-CoA dehydratase [Escherichia albertii]MCU7303707.1 2-hydroxyacyl-CoA dehydratase family protein [Escherichia albertii]
MSDVTIASSEYIPAKKRLQKIAADAYQRAWDAKKRGEKIGWCASNFPQEIAETLDVCVVYPENQAAAIAAKGGGLRMCEHAESMGYSNDICAYARISLSFMDVKHCDEMDMPQPDFLLCSNNICNCMIKWYENIAYELQIPMILIDIPYKNDYETDDISVRYIQSQFDDAIRKLEGITGKTFSMERFNEVCEISQRTGKAWLKAAEYCQYHPSPMNGFDLFNHMAVAVCARGKKEAADAFELLCEEMEQNIREQKSTWRGEEKYRILFEGIACWPYLRATSTPLKEHGMNVTATVYATAFGVIYQNSEEMMRAYSYVPNCVSVERAADMRIDVCRQNKVDGAVIHINRSCKMWSGIMPKIERKLRRELSIPTVTFDGDQADPRGFSEAQYVTRIEALAEIMATNKVEMQGGKQ